MDGGEVRRLHHEHIEGAQVQPHAIDVARMDLRKKVRCKRRTNRHEREFYRGRTYADWLAL